MIKLTNNVIVKSIIIFIFYYLIISGLNILTYLTLGRYIVEETTLNLELISLIDTFVYVICFIVFYFILFKKNIFKKTEASNVFSLKILILVSLTILSYKIVVDPIYRFDLIIRDKTFPEFQQNKIKLIEKLILFLNTVLIAPIFEELVFRSVILKDLIAKKGTLFSVIFSSLLYSLIHLNVISFSLMPILNGFLVGIIFSIIYLRFRIIFAIIAHVFFNLLWFFLDLYKFEYWDFEKTLNFNETYWIIVFIAFLVLLINLYLLIKKGVKIK